MKTNKLVKLFSILLALTMIFALAACTNTNTTTDETTAAAETTTAAPKGTIRLATTTSVNDSGLLPYLLPTFEAETGWKVEVASAGTGVAIGYAQAGDADLLLVHSKDQEEQFIADGYASTDRQSFMYNFFVLCGPASDPAGVKGSATAAEAFKKIADAKQPFCSRGDNSGTHNKEMKIWSAAAPVLKLDPAWYTSVGSGMGDTLTKANEMNAYVLTEGRCVPAHWWRKDYHKHTTYYYEDDSRIHLNTGKTMIFIIRDHMDTFAIDGVSYMTEGAPLTPVSY